jgi:hypothetical protein
MSERYVGLPCLLTLLAPIALYPKGQVAGFAAEGEVVQNAPDNAISDDMETSAMRTDASLGNDCFEVKENCITFVLGTGIGVALNTVCLI